MPYPKNPIDRFALGRQITRAADASVAEILAGYTQPPKNGAVRIGITGPPGAGKSSLVARLCRRELQAGRRIGVIAIDPTSPFTSGAILGDRIRMEDVSGHEDLFIRSLASRGAHNGLTDNLPEILLAMDSHHFDAVIIETVGVGQVECAVRDLVDTTVLVLHPQSGDQVQAMKAGVLEAADIIVVNKADLPGAGQIAAEIQAVIRIRQYSERQWIPRVLTASRQDEAGLDVLAQVLAQHLEWVRAHSDPIATRRARVAYHLSTLVMRRAGECIRQLAPESLDAGVAAAYKDLVRVLR
jgi:LAO/AO transport system kinase